MVAFDHDRPSASHKRAVPVTRPGTCSLSRAAWTDRSDVQRGAPLAQACRAQARRGGQWARL